MQADFFFRNSGWHFPVGLMDTITYPELYSVVYTDAVPAFAVVFKILSPVFPKTFQYFGIWGLLCFILYICSMDASPALYAFIAGGPLDFAAVHPELPENR